MNSHINIIQQLNNFITVIYIIYKKYEKIFTLFKLFKISGFQTKMVFKQRLKYLKIKKNNFIKLILKQE